MSIYSDALDAFKDRFSDILDYDGFTPVLAENAGIPTHWQDDISELADSLVPIYTADIMREWTEAGYPDVEDPGMIEGVTDITKIMQVALYELYSQELYQLAYEAGFDA